MVLRCYWFGVVLCAAAFLSGASTLSADSGLYPTCSSLHPEGVDYLSLGDGICNEVYNTEGCGYDAGDCCPCTCKSRPSDEPGLSLGSECGSAGYNCLDPAAPCFDGSAVNIRYLQSTDSYADSLSPTATPTASPTAESFLDDLAEEVSSAASGLSDAAIGAIIGVCLVAAIIVAVYCLYKKRQSAADGPEYAAAGSTNLA